MSIYAGISLATLQSRLTEAQDAYHALNTGAQTVSISTGDKRLSFTPATVDKLRTYIKDLQSAIDVAQGITPRRLTSVAKWTR
jgi:hypothetical protein